MEGVGRGVGDSVSDEVSDAAMLEKVADEDFKEANVVEDGSDVSGLLGCWSESKLASSVTATIKTNKSLHVFFQSKVILVDEVAP